MIFSATNEALNDFFLNTKMISFVLFSLLHPPYVIDAMLREDFTKVRKPAKGLEK